MSAAAIQSVEQPDAPRESAHTLQRVDSAIRSYIPPQVSSVASSLRCCVATAASHATQSVHSHLLSYPLYKSLFTRIRALPIIEFYIYMWRVDPILFANTMFANYGLPVLMEGRSQLNCTAQRQRQLAVDGCLHSSSLFAADSNPFSFALFVLQPCRGICRGARYRSCCANHATPSLIDWLPTSTSAIRPLRASCCSAWFMHSCRPWNKCSGQQRARVCPCTCAQLPERPHRALCRV